MEEFSVKSESKGDVSIVAVAGRVDSVTAATLDTELAKVLQNNKKMVIDLKDAAYLSSAGVRAIVRVLQSAKKAGGGVKLACIPQNIMDVFETVGMLQMLETYSTVDEAAGSF